MTWILKIFTDRFSADPEVRQFETMRELGAFLRIASLDDVKLIIIYPEEAERRNVCMPYMR